MQLKHIFDKIHEKYPDIFPIEFSIKKFRDCFKITISTKDIRMVKIGKTIDEALDKLGLGEMEADEDIRDFLRGFRND